MPIRYFVKPDGTSLRIGGDNAASQPVPSGYAEVNETVYNSVTDAFFAKAEAAQAAFGTAHLLVSRSAERGNSSKLQGNQLDVGKLYAVFIPDAPALGITKVDFYLDNVFHNDEFTAPWDYDGTVFGGGASRVTFSAGTHTIKAEIFTASGSSVVEAEFNVE